MVRVSDSEYAQLETAATMAPTYYPVPTHSHRDRVRGERSSIPTPVRVAIVVGIGMLPFVGVAATSVLRPTSHATQEINDAQSIFDYGVGVFAVIVGGLCLVIRVVRGSREQT